MNSSRWKKGRTPWNKGMKGVQVVWNKGLTKETDPRVAKYAKKCRKRKIKNRKKPRISMEERNKRSERMIGDKNPMKRPEVRKK